MWLLDCCEQPTCRHNTWKSYEIHPNIWSWESTLEDKVGWFSIEWSIVQSKLCRIIWKLQPIQPKWPGRSKMCPSDLLAIFSWHNMHHRCSLRRILQSPYWCIQEWWMIKEQVWLTIGRAKIEANRGMWIWLSQIEQRSQTLRLRSRWQIQGSLMHLWLQPLPLWILRKFLFKPKWSWFCNPSSSSVDSMRLPQYHKQFQWRKQFELQTLCLQAWSTWSSVWIKTVRSCLSLILSSSS